MDKTIRVIISGGGTGGHVFPAIAIADALKKIHHNIHILFVGAKNRMEMDKVPAAGYEIIGLPVIGLQRKLSLKNIAFIYKLMRSIFISKNIISSFKPDVVVGVGGFASYPVLRVATKKGIPIVLQEQNSYPGLTNRMLGKRAALICAAYDEIKTYFPEIPVHITGNPVRQDVVDVKDKRQQGYEHFQLEEGRKTLLIVGGSLGAKTINKSVVKHIETISRNNQIQVLWQAGKYYINEMKKIVDNMMADNIHVMEFISAMDMAFAVADVIISRAGAISISEISTAGLPAIFVPSPNVVADHQTKNAKALVKNNAAILITDERAEVQLLPQAIELLENEEQQKMLAQNIRKMAVNNSAENIANNIIEIIKY
jgi:UDP-N-acetylglucosamine--N-acetylmuramyl-(pentapeptide) pyrophosphoryl-undecaprenol N-acetylglucosamine transferase